MELDSVVPEPIPVRARGGAPSSSGPRWSSGARRSAGSLDTPNPETAGNPRGSAGHAGGLPVTRSRRHRNVHRRGMLLPWRSCLTLAGAREAPGTIATSVGYPRRNRLAKTVGLPFALGRPPDLRSAASSSAFGCVHTLPAAREWESAADRAGVLALPGSSSVPTGPGSPAPLRGIARQQPAAAPGPPRVFVRDTGSESRVMGENSGNSAPRPVRTRPFLSEASVSFHGCESGLDSLVPPGTKWPD